MIKQGLIYLSLVALFGFSACKKFLDQPPDNRAELNSPEQVSQLLGTAYPQANYMSFFESISDNVGDKGDGVLERTNTEPYHFEDVTEVEQDSPEYYWQACYAAIAAANQALEICNTATPRSAYNSQRGEALLARAYAHFMLVNVFSKVYDPASANSDPGIPYVTEPEKVVEKQYERKTVAYVYDMIEKDITEGLPLIDDKRYTVPRYHFTKAAANAFAARYYLFKRDYAKVVEHASQVFASGNVASVLRPWNTTYLSVTYLELFARYAKATEPANLLLVEAPSLWARSLRGYRYGFSYHLLTTLVWDKNVTSGMWGYMFYGTELTLFTPKFREHFVKTDPNADFGTPYNMVPLLTTEEVLFNRAEAYARLQRYDEALKDLNDWASTRIVVNDSDKPYYDPAQHLITRPRALSFYNTKDVEAAIISTILDFKRVEFLWEGLRWFDIVRHRLPVVHTPYNRENIMTLGPNDPRRVIQIPQEAQMSGLELNPR